MSPPDATSRYAGLPEIEVVAADGSVRRLGAPRTVPAPPASSAYDVRTGDRLDLLGLAATGDSTRWWALADANPWIDPGRLERPGTRIRLPDA
jgi:nucleoid-associated protein YgaU